jgi:hypothetical protein
MGIADLTGADLADVKWPVEVSVPDGWMVDSWPVGG